MKMNMDTILRTEHLCKYYGSGENEVRAVDDVNIAIGRGEFVAVVGNQVPERARCCTCWGDSTIRRAGRCMWVTWNSFR